MKKIIFRSLVAVVVLLLAGTFGMVLYLRGAFTHSRPVTEAGGTAIAVGTSGHRIVGRDYLFGPPSAGSPLIIVLHGDAPARKPSYQYMFAKNVAKSAPGTHVVALLRPGYADPFGARSDGDHGLFATADNYTPEVIEDLTSAIEELKAKFAAQTVIVVGHSGGAALTADIAARTPGLIQTAFLIGCPCDVPAFRKHMANAQHSLTWLLPVRSISPMQTLDGMSANTTVRAISGFNDAIALPVYARAYVEKAQSQKIPASLRILPNADHEILLDDAVIAEVVAAAKQTTTGVGGQLRDRR